MNPRLLLLAVLSLAPTAAFGAPSSSAEPAEHLGLGVTRAEIQTMYERPGVGFQFDKPDFECPTGFVRDRKTTEDMCVAGGPGAGSEDAGRIKGAPRVMGYAPTGDRTTALFLVGPPEDLQKASLMMTFLPSRREQWPVNILYAGALIEEILGWPGGTDWAIENVPKAVESGPIELRRGNRLVRVSATAGMPIVFVSVEAVESPESVAAREAAERRADGARALAEGDGLQGAGRLSAAITAWDPAARIPETASAARSRQAHAWVKLAAELAPSDTSGAIKALDAAAKAAPTGEADRVEREGSVVRVSLARSLATSSPAVARTVLLASKAAQAADPDLLRTVTVAVARASCSDASLTLYAEAGELGPLTHEEREDAGECALTLTSGDLDAGRVSDARQHFDASQSYAPSLTAADDVGRSLRKAERKAAHGGGYDARPLVGRLMLGGGAVMLIPAVLSYGQAGSAQEQIQSGPHAGTEVESLAATGRSSETRAWLWAGGAVAVAATGFGVLVWHAGAQHADAGIYDVRVAVIPGPATSVTLALEW